MTISRCKRPGVTVTIAVVFAITPRTGSAQAYGEPDTTSPGDRMIQSYLQRQALELHETFREDTESLQGWKERRSQYTNEYLHMLGLSPLPEKTPLEATVTGTYEGDGFSVELLHYQSHPRLYVTANLYRPARIPRGERLPAVLYVCGHSGRGRDGNKTAFQSHGIWFARHGYVCLVLDTLQLGEIGATHHGTYREQRWWWHSRGYTPAGVECWNGVRGIDYLVSRADVDPQRIAVTGISGGGAATFWVAAADPRVAVAAPVSGMADLPSYLSNRVINGHCDCMFLHNAFEWPWTRIAALIAPRPMLFVNSDADSIFPMDANERVINRLEMIYRLYGAGDLVDSVVSVGGHAYRKDIRQAVYRFINTHLKNDPSIVADSETDLVTGGAPEQHPIHPGRLRVFPRDEDLPGDERNTAIDRHFVPLARLEPPKAETFATWKDGLFKELRRVSLRAFPKEIPPAQLREKETEPGVLRVETEPGILVTLSREQPPGSPPGKEPDRVLVIVQNAGSKAELSDWHRSLVRKGDAVYLCAPRGIGSTQWTRRNPPNYVERSLVLLGTTADTGRVRDVAAAARFLGEQRHRGVPLHVAGEQGAAVLCALVAIVEPSISGVFVSEPPPTFMNPAAPQILNILRVCDVPAVFGMISPRPLSMHKCPEALADGVIAIYAAGGLPERLEIVRK